jgi:hypothetical protein
MRLGKNLVTKIFRSTCFLSLLAADPCVEVNVNGGSSTDCPPEKQLAPMLPRPPNPPAPPPPPPTPTPNS